MEEKRNNRSTPFNNTSAHNDPVRKEIESSIPNSKEVTETLSLKSAEPDAPTEKYEYSETLGISGASPTCEQTKSTAGRRIGNYRILRTIADGGMGTVYLAVRDDDVYQKQVAIKLIKHGMDTEEILHRFRIERQVLAKLDHPNIAKLLDGGTTEERLPYYVMEYIDGTPITVYCDAHKLPIIERLKLFRTVCSAVQYAHQNLVVHRDIKPSNILVTAEGVPKLLDFGIAKILNQHQFFAETLQETQPGVRLMTPRYASPEQIQGEVITTASDIYSLGVLVYELLTGHSPYRLRSYQQYTLEYAICEVEPEKPSYAISRVEKPPDSDNFSQPLPTLEEVSATRNSTPLKLRRQLAGDLDTIVLKALRKEPQQRYASVEKFSEDVQRYLDGYPVLARKGTLRYHALKFVGRNWLGVAAAMLILVTLLGGIIATTWQARRAERRFNEVKELANSFLSEFDDEIRDLPGSTRARELMVKKGLKYLDSLAQEAGDDRELQQQLAAGYEKIGETQWNRYYANLGDTSGAIQSLNKAQTIRERLLAKDPSDLQNRFKLTFVYIQIGDLVVAKGDAAGGLAYYRKALTISQGLATADAKNVGFRRALAICYERIGDTLGNPSFFPNLGDKAGALENYQQSFALFESISAADPANLDYRNSVSISYEKIANMQQAAGDKVGALETYRKVLTIREQVSAANPKSTRFQSDLAIAYVKVGVMQEAIGDINGALESYRQALKIREELSAVDPANAKAREHLYGTYELIINLLVNSGQPQKAYNYTARYLVLKKERANSPGATADNLNAYAWLLLTCVPTNLRDPATAIVYAKKAVEMTKENDPNILDTLAMAYHLMNDHIRAIETEEKALALLKNDSALRGELEENLAKFKAALKRE